VSGQNDADMETIYTAYLMLKNGIDMSKKNAQTTYNRVMANLKELLIRRGDYKFE
jgi:hypothetical protein